jgi:cell division protein FtsB
MAFSFKRGLAALLPVVLALLLAPAAFGQSTEERVRELERQVEQLKAEIAVMKDGGQESEAGRLAELERRLEVLAGEIENLKIGEAAAAADESERGFGPAASKVYRTERGLSIGGYGEALYQNFDSKRDDNAASGKTDTFDLLRGVLYFGYKFNDRWLLNSEIEYEHAGSEVAVEFAYIDYLWRLEVNVRGGLLLVPMGFLNELHEPTVFLGARRPDVEQLIMPTTWRENGLGLFGDAGPFTYRTYVVNGLRGAGFTAAGLRGGRQKGNQAKAEDFAWVGRLDFTGVPGLLVGGSAYIGDSGQDLTTAGGRDIGVGTQILEAHLEWKWRGLELRALGVQAELDDVADLNQALKLTGNQSVGESLKGHYLQLGYDVLAGRGGEQAFIPYARWETYNTQDEVPRGFAANPANDVETLTLGFAYQPIDQLVLKVDHQNIDNEAGTGTDQFNVLLGWIF